MKITLEIPDERAAEFMAAIEAMDFVTLEEEKPRLLLEIEEAVRNLNLVKAGKMKARPAKDLLDEL